MWQGVTKEDEVKYYIRWDLCPHCKEKGVLMGPRFSRDREGIFLEQHCIKCGYYYFPNSLQYQVHKHEEVVEDTVLEYINKIREIIND